MPMLAIVEKRRGVKSFMLVGYSGNLVCIFDVYLFSITFSIPRKEEVNDLKFFFILQDLRLAPLYVVG